MRPHYQRADPSAPAGGLAFYGPIVVDTMQTPSVVLGHQLIEIKHMDDQGQSTTDPRQFTKEIRELRLAYADCMKTPIWQYDERTSEKIRELRQEIEEALA